MFRVSKTSEHQGLYVDVWDYMAMYIYSNNGKENGNYYLGISQVMENGIE